MQKRKQGQPTKLTPERAVKIHFLARRGCTDKQIAEILDVTEKTICNWKKTSSFFQSLKVAKAEADALVEISLFERATGYSHPETKVFQHEGQIITEETVKHYPPDAVACIFWLKNRRPLEWREKREVEHSGEISIVQLMRVAAAARNVNVLADQN